MRKVWLVLLGSMSMLLGSAGCEGSGGGPQDCTLAYCTDGITVEVENLAQRVGGSDEAKASLCSGARCATFNLREIANVGVICDFVSGNRDTDECLVADGKVRITLGIVSESPTNLELTVKATADDDAIQKSVEAATDKTVQPNGPDCPPVCQQGTTTVSL